MYSFSDSEFVQFILIAASMFLIGKVITHFFRQEKEHQQREIWKTFAEDCNLRFTPPNFFNSNVRIHGHYRGYNVKFFTSRHQRAVSGNKTESYTCTNAVLFFEPRNIDNEEIATSRKSNDQEYTKQDLIDLLFPKGLINRPQKNRKNFRISLEADGISYNHEGFEGSKIYLTQLLNMLCDLADNNPKVIQLGGKVVPALQSIVSNDGYYLGSIAISLLEAIGLQSQELRNKKLDLLCRRCLARYEAIKVSWRRNITYYACPRCYQNHNYFCGRVVTLLDSQMEQERFETGDTLKVNWFAYRKVFDFDAIEIEQATDEDVERFAVQIGNDTDEARSSRYQKMGCTISPRCKLSENTLRILEHIVGSVEIRQGENIPTI